jgi:predicted DNA-binding transcriptional regulator AlpA
MPRLVIPQPTPGVNWDTLQDLLLLEEVCAMTRHAIKTAYAQLSEGRFPIAHLPDVRPYRFRKADVRAWVVDGRPTNKAVQVANRRRRKVA